jgi:hypothetical protein
VPCLCSDGAFFDATWAERVQRYDRDANWRVKANNLRKVQKRVNEYYDECLHRRLPPESPWIFDAGVIGQ